MLSLRGEGPAQRWYEMSALPGDQGPTGLHVRLRQVRGQWYREAFLQEMPRDQEHADRLQDLQRDGGLSPGILRRLTIPVIQAPRVPPEDIAPEALGPGLIKHALHHQGGQGVIERLA